MTTFEMWDALSAEQKRLYEIVQLWHSEQRRKYSNEPYVNHLLTVATIVRENCDEPGLVEIALCHDLYEDTKFERWWMTPVLQAIGYPKDLALFIEEGIFMLTDHFIHEKYPGMNRQARKEAEAERLGNIKAEYQTVKYADIIDNSASIVPRDPGFAKVYMVEIRRTLRNMREGSPVLLGRCERIVEEFFDQQ